MLHSLFPGYSAPSKVSSWPASDVSDPARPVSGSGRGASNPGAESGGGAAQFDFRADAEVDAPWEEARLDSVLLFDGVFLHRPELFPHWDFTVFVAADFDVTSERAGLRDQDLFGSPRKIREIYQRRYIPGQKIYLETERPFEKANVVFRKFFK